MKKTILFLITYLIVNISIPSPNYYIENIPEINNNKTISSLKVIELMGTSYEIGKQHGEKLKEEIKSIISLWKNDLRRTYKVDPKFFISSFYENTNYKDAMKKWTPELLEEVKGISDGCGIDYKTIFVFQLIDETWVSGSEIIEKHKCTSIGIKKHKGEFNIELIKKVLRSKEGSGATINNGSTFGSTIMVLKEKPELYIIAGDPSLSEYKKFVFG